MKCRRLIPFLLCFLLLAGCKKPGEPVQTNWVLTQEDAFLFSDGTSVDIWEMDPLFTQWDYYRLEDGTDLLVVEETISPLHVSVGYLTLQDLSEESQTAICDYYEAQGLLYDIPATLEKAYAEYRSSGDTGAVFTGYRLHQQSAPCSFGDKVVCFVTILQEPVRENIMNKTRLCAYFDRETGKPISLWELFAVPEAEARAHLITAFAADEKTAKEMAAALKPEYVALEEDCVAIFFPAGSLPSAEYATGAAIDYHQLSGILHDWAIPNDINP